jgi:hypothetical protein
MSPRHAVSPTSVVSTARGRTGAATSGATRIEQGSASAICGHAIASAGGPFEAGGGWRWRPDVSSRQWLPQSWPGSGSIKP